MLNEELEIGRVVIAKAGRDKGKAFIVIGRLDRDHVLIANGVGRTIEKPKKKKIKHLEKRPEIAQAIGEKLISGKKVFDAELRKSLRSLGYEK